MTSLSPLYAQAGAGRSQVQILSPRFSVDPRKSANTGEIPRKRWVSRDAVCLCSPLFGGFGDRKVAAAGALRSFCGRIADRKGLGCRQMANARVLLPVCRPLGYQPPTGSGESIRRGSERPWRCGFARGRVVLDGTRPDGHDKAPSSTVPSPSVSLVMMGEQYCHEARLDCVQPEGDPLSDEHAGRCMSARLETV
jgi:hypothetical protein